MPIEEIRRNIRALCEEMIEFTSTHKYIENIQTESQSDISGILLRAKTAMKKSLAVYEQFRHELASVANSSTQYETAVKKLAAILNV